MSQTNLFISSLTNLILKLQITKILDWLIYISTTLWKTSNQHTTTISLKYLPPHGMILLICLMVLIQFMTFKITFEFIIKKHETLVENSPIQIYPNKTKNRIVFKVKTGYKLELLPLKTMKLLGSTKKDVDKDKDGEDEPKLESAEVVLVYCNLVNNSYQQASYVLFTFVPNKQIGQLIITISPHVLTMLKTTNPEFQSIQVWFTDQNNRPLEIEDRVNITLIIG